MHASGQVQTEVAKTPSRLDTKNHMRSSKSRSRGNKNRSNNRPSGGNIINRVFDSSGPDGKVRGTPQQIIEKYNQLHRDAQLSNDRVNSENFAQHAEHYTRILAEAQREIDRAREEQEQQNRDRQVERDRQAERDRERQQRLRSQEEGTGSGKGNGPQDQSDPSHSDSGQQDNRRNSGQARNRPEAVDVDPGSAEQPEYSMDIADVGFLKAGDQQSTLVDTPEETAEQAPKAEAKPKAPRAPRPRKPRAPKAAADDGGSSAGQNADTGPAEAAE